MLSAGHLVAELVDGELVGDLAVVEALIVRRDGVDVVEVGGELGRLVRVVVIVRATSTWAWPLCHAGAGRVRGCVPKAVLNCCQEVSLRARATNVCTSCALSCLGLRRLLVSTRPKR